MGYVVVVILAALAVAATGRVLLALRRPSERPLVGRLVWSPVTLLDAALGAVALIGLAYGAGASVRAGVMAAGAVLGALGGVANELRRGDNPAFDRFVAQRGFEPWERRRTVWRPWRRPRPGGLARHPDWLARGGRRPRRKPPQDARWNGRTRRRGERADRPRDSAGGAGGGRRRHADGRLARRPLRGRDRDRATARSRTPPAQPASRRASIRPLSRPGASRTRPPGSPRPRSKRRCGRSSCRRGRSAQALGLRIGSEGVLVTLQRDLAEVVGIDELAGVAAQVATAMRSQTLKRTLITSPSATT